MMTQLPDGWCTVALADLLTPAQMDHIAPLLRSGDDTGLHTYLRSIATDLEAKGVLPDYLFYALKHVIG